MSSWVVQQTVEAIRQTTPIRGPQGVCYFQWVPVMFGVVRKCSGCGRGTAAVALTLSYGAGSSVADACLLCWTERRPVLLAAVCRAIAGVVRNGDLGFRTPADELQVLAELAELELLHGPR